MAFCTIVEWDSEIDPGAYAALEESAGAQTELPAGCLSRLIGRAEKGPCVIEVWETRDDAKRYTEQSAPKTGASEIPPPTRVVGFVADVYQSR
jgi:hypothetical protein